LIVWWWGCRTDGWEVVADGDEMMGLGPLESGREAYTGLKLRRRVEKDEGL